MRKRVLSIILLNLFIAVAFAQIKKGTKPFKQPLDYDSPTGAILPIHTKNTDRSADWIVYSDRDENQTYSDPNGYTKKKVVQFMEAFWVIEEKDNFIRIVKYDPGMIVDISKRILSEACEDYGWIKKENLLLWREALISNEKRYSIKGLSIISDPNFMSNMSQYTNKNNELKVFNNPELSGESEKSIAFSKFLFIYKKEKGSLLISQSNEFEGPSSAKYKIQGWVKASAITEWSDRLCIEPNKKAEAVSERKKYNIEASILPDKIDASQYKTEGKTSDLKVMWHDDPYEKGFEVNKKRFPVLKNENGIIKTGFETDILDKKGTKIVDESEYLKAKVEIEKKKGQLRKVNIVYVVNGNLSMKNYFDPITNSIKNLNSQFNEMNDYFVGAVVYRDKASNASTCATEVKELTADRNQVSSFLEQSFAKSEQCNTVSKEDAVFEGVAKACRLFTGKEGETNVIILIGSAGNYESDQSYDKDKIAALMAKARVHLLAFQAARGNDITFTNFIQDFKKIIRKSAELINAKGQESNTAQKANYIPKLDFKQDENNENAFKLRFPDASPVQGWLVFASMGSSFKSEDLIASVSQIIEKIDEDIELKIAGVNARLNGMGERTKIELNPALLMVFSEIEDMIKGDKDIISKLTEQNYQFFVTGYTTMNTNNLVEPLFSNVLFITDDEFTKLNEELKQFEVKTSTGSEGRIQLQKVFKQIVQTYLGSEAKKRIKTIQLGEVLGLITGLSSTSSLLSKYKIEDLTNDKVLNNSEFTKIVEYILNQSQKLQDIKGKERNKFRYQEDNGDYYWVPAEYMP
jgi:hypothetical protein